jgi:hypothetical protein
LNSISRRKKDLKISAVFTPAQTLSDSLLTPENIQVSYGEGGAWPVGEAAWGSQEAAVAHLE